MFPIGTLGTGAGGVMPPASKNMLWPSDDVGCLWLTGTSTDLGNPSIDGFRSPVTDGRSVALSKV